MKVKYLLLLLLMAGSASLKAQVASDSAVAARTFKELLSICRKPDFTDPKVQKYGTFYNAAPYIIYRGSERKRTWKDFANYPRPEEKKEVDEICEKINLTVNQDPNYKIIEYFTKTESEGTWHVLMVSYNKKGTEKKISFAFLKLGNRFALGDIDPSN